MREEDLVAQAVGGDIAAVEQLLLGHYDRLAAEIGRKLPAELRGTITADDVLQEAFINRVPGDRLAAPAGPDPSFEKVRSQGI